MTATRTVLHVGCGPRHIDGLHEMFRTPEWTEIRLDIDPAAEPDIVGSITGMPMVASGSMDAVWSANNLEHVFPHEVDLTVREFVRVLKPDGFLMLHVPDLRSICELVAQDALEDVIYESESGPITPIDMIFGLRSALAGGYLAMAHKTGFTGKTLRAALARNGFTNIEILELPDAFQIWGLAYTRPVPNPLTLFVKP
ncbi:MAG: class I SAM-dependent methyltransferase [Alphaproteobacteria bacterium]